MRGVGFELRRTTTGDAKRSRSQSVYYNSDTLKGIAAKGPRPGPAPSECWHPASRVSGVPGPIHRPACTDPAATNPTRSPNSENATRARASRRRPTQGYQPPAPGVSQLQVQVDPPP